MKGAISLTHLGPFLGWRVFGDEQMSRGCSFTTIQRANKQTSKQASKQTSKQANKQTSKKANKQTSKQANKQTSKHANKQTSKQANKQTSKQANKQTSKQANKQTGGFPVRSTKNPRKPLERSTNVPLANPRSAHGPNRHPQSCRLFGRFVPLD